VLPRAAKNDTAASVLKIKRRNRFTGRYFTIRSIQQPHQFLNLPNMIGKASLHRWGDSQRLMNPAVVVVHEVKCDVMGTKEFTVSRIQTDPLTA
jgi:hypothetical protein